MNIRIFFIEFLFSCICESKSISYFPLQTVLISRLIESEAISIGGTLNDPESLNFTQNQFYEQYYTSEQIYIHPLDSYHFLIYYIESKKIVNALKNPSFLIDFLPDVPSKCIKCSSFCTFSLPGGYDIAKKKNQT